MQLEEFWRSGYPYSGDNRLSKVCALCGRKNLEPGHSKREQKILKNSKLKETIMALWGKDANTSDEQK